MDVFEKCSRPHPMQWLVDQGFHAFLRELESGPEAEVRCGGRTLLMFGSNNYLGLATHPLVKQAAIEATLRYGTGTTGSRLLNGTLDLHVDVERRLARFLRREAALFFTSGYMANLGVISALAQRGDVVVVDRHAHASIVDGARLSFAEVRRFRHEDPRDLERVLAGCGDAGKLVAVDGVYSMGGEICRLPRLAAVCRRHGARLVLDDAHGLGVLGRAGRGTAEHFGLEEQVDLVVGTTSKALPAVGGFAAGDEQVIRFLRESQANRPFTFAASPPPAAVAAVRAALEIVERQPALRRTLWDHTRRVHRALTAMGFDVGRSGTPIVPVVAGSVERTVAMWKLLTDDGLFVNVVLPPAVAPGACIIRLTLTAGHTRAQIDRLLAALERAGRRLGILRGGPGEAGERGAA